MKKTFPVNINGTIFYIDEDAYRLLSTYIEQLHQAFSGNEGNEIVGDIEARISEIFAEKIACGAKAITIDDVNEVIERMGNPDDLSDSPESRQFSSDATPPPYPSPKRKLFRNMQNKVFGGVLGGLACYFGWNATILRVLMVVLALATHVWPLTVIYLVAWMVIPAAMTPRQVLEMNGTPVTIGNLGQAVVESISSSETSIINAISKVSLGFLGIIAGLIGVVFVVKFIDKLSHLIVYLVSHDTNVLFPEHEVFFNPVLSAVGHICMSLSIALPCVALAAAACITLFRLKPVSKAVTICGIVLEIILIIAAIVMISISKIPL